MTLNGRAITLKQLRHLVGGEPDGVVGEADFNLRLAALCLKKYNLSVIHTGHLIFIKSAAVLFNSSGELSGG